jgi:hypothetical protein
MSAKDSTSSLFQSVMNDNEAEEKKDWKKKEFLNIASETDIKRRQHAFHDELRKEKR